MKQVLALSVSSAFLKTVNVTCSTNFRLVSTEVPHPLTLFICFKAVQFRLKYTPGYDTGKLAYLF